MFYHHSTYRLSCTLGDKLNTYLPLGYSGLRRDSRCSQAGVQLQKAGGRAVVAKPAEAQQQKPSREDAAAEVY